MSIDVLGLPLSEVANHSKSNPFDVVIVGGGSSGLTAARTLAENGRSVAVLEAGPAPFLTHLANTELRFSRDMIRSVRGQVGYSPKLAGEDDGKFGNNFSCLGGRGLFWNGSSPRYQAHDFDGWPISIDTLIPYYEWAEHEFRVTSQLGENRLGIDMIARLNRAGFPARPGPFAVDVDPVGNGHLSASIASVLAPFFRSVAQAVFDKQIQLSINAQVVEIVIEDGRARGVTAADAEGQRHEIMARSVVLAAGGIESIRLAALSEIPDPDGRIGKGIQDHLFVRYYFEGAHLYDPDKRETAVLHIPASSQSGEQWEVQAPGRLLWKLDADDDWAPDDGPGYELMIRSFCATIKSDTNHIESATGPLGAATVHFKHSDEDLQRVAKMQEHGAAIGEALNLTQTGERIFAPGSSYHEAGGLDMGEDPSTSVTDPKGQFHTVQSLYCFDAAAFPSIGAANPHLTLVAESRRKALALDATLA